MNASILAPVDMTVQEIDNVYDASATIKMTVGVTETFDNAPYLSRQSGGENNSNVGKKLSDKIIGGTIAWNQLVKNPSFENTSSWESVTNAATLSASNNIGKLTITDNTKTGRPNIRQTGIASPIVGHKYLISFGVKISSSTLSANSSISLLYGSNISIGPAAPDEQWHDFKKIVQVSALTYPYLTLYCSTLISGFSNNDSIEYRNVCIIDLTAAFGSTIADHLYSIENSTVGAGVNKLRYYGFITKEIYENNDISLESVNVSFHIMRDSNNTVIGNYALDHSKEFRGIVKLDTNNKLYYDGDEYESNGTITRKYAIRSYQSGDETDGLTMITDGTNTVYKLTEPIIEQGIGFTNPQNVDKNGTEEYIDYAESQGTRDVSIPVGHETYYPTPVIIDAPESGDYDMTITSENVVIV